MNEELRVIISAEISKLKKNVADAKSSVKGFADQVKKAKEDADKHIKAMGEKIGNGLKTAAGVGAAALAGVGAALVGVSEATAEYRNNQAKLTTTFEAANGSAAVAKETYRDLYRVLGDDGQATEAAAHLAQLTTNEKDLAEWTTACQGIYATFGASLPIEGLTEAANETAKVGTVTGSLADALNWAKVTNEEFSKTLSGNKEAQAAFNKAIAEGETREDAFNAALAACNTEAEREELIRNSLTGTYNNAAAAYEKNNKATLAQNEAQAKLTDNLAKVGEAVAPVITAFTNFANEALAKVQPYISDLAEKYGPELQTVLEKVADIAGKVVGVVVDNWQIIVAIAGVIGGIATAIGIYNAVAAVKAAMAAAEVTSVWALVAAYAAQAVAVAAALAPYLLIVAAIAAVIAIIVLCVKHWDTIKEAVKNAFAKMKEAVAEGIEKIKAFFQKVIDFVKNNWQGLLLLIVNPFAGAFKLAYDNCEGFREKVDNFIAKVKEIFTKGFTAAKEIIVSIFEGIKNNIQNKIETAKNIIKNVVTLIKSIFTGDFGAAKQAVLNIFDSISTGIKNKIENAKNTVKNVVDKIKGVFNFKWSLPSLKIPKITVSGGEAPYGIAGKGSLPKFSITWNAKGGVFDKPTLFSYGNSLQGLGENGAEAVVPLEKNTQWLDRLATMLNEKQGSRPIILKVGKKVFGEIAVESINDITTQTGNIPLIFG